MKIFDISNRFISASGLVFSSAAVRAAVLTLMAPVTSYAGVNLAWNPVADPRVAVYEVAYGTESVTYSQRVETTEAKVTLDGLDQGQEYFFAVRVCDSDRVRCGGYSSEVSITPSSTETPPSAEFTVDKTIGEAPLMVLFTETSSGEITNNNWDFGDGNTVTDARVTSHTYTVPGTYTVKLTVAGPGGTDTVVKDGLVSIAEPAEESKPEVSMAFLELGEIELNHEWQRIGFVNSYIDPVVIANTISNNGSQPAIVRIGEVNTEGFSMRLQEWDYLDQTHAYETVAFIVMESGKHSLPNGTWVEAGLIESDRTSGFDTVALTAQFQDAPVVMASMNTYNEAAAATVRTKVIDSTLFQLRIQEQESNTKSRAPEDIAFIAWEPGVGTVEGRTYEVGITADAVKHKPYRINFDNTFSDMPSFLAAMQSLDGGDTANVRYRNLSGVDVEVWVDEEQSKDKEVRHTTEAVGYIAFDYR